MLVSQVEKKKTNVLEQIDQVSKLLALLIGIATLTTFFIAKFHAGQVYFEAVSTALVCCVAMVPEGLEAIVTLTYAWAVTNMAKNNAIIRALPAVETLGSVTVICSDKTGTLTQNVMSLTAFVTSNARYKFDVNSTDRVPSNFVRDDGYISERAQHQMKKSVSSVIKDGANSGEKRKGHIESSNHFSIDTSLHPAEVEETSGEVKESDPTPFPDGSSPTLEFVHDALAGGVLCSKCVLGENGTRKNEIGNPTELSILRAAYFSGIDIKDMKDNAPFHAEVPFSSEYKFMATIHDEGDAESFTCHVKGAPDRMVKLCKYQATAGVVGENEPIDTDYWIENIAVLSSHGLRVLALCRADVPRDSVEKGENLGPEFVNGRDEPWLTIVGLCAMMDPPRPECVDAIKEAKGAGVRVAMITGDHKDTATAIGHMLGIVDEKFNEAITGPELDEMDDEEIKNAVMSHNVFARASPQNKIRIVKALQAQKQICSMTGDGVNDAPALKAADMGVAMGKEGTDVAREASQMILADDNFATIVTAVREGRVVWDNLRKVLLFNTPVNNAQGLTVLFGMIVGLPYAPLTPIQVLYCNLICAVTLGFVLAVEPAEKGIMARPPRKVGKRLIGRYLLFRIAFGTLVLVTFTVGAVMWVFGWGISDNINQFTEPLCVANNMETTTDPRTNEKFCCMYRQNCDESCTNQIWILGDPKSASPFEFEIEHNRYGMHCPNVVGRAKVRAQASNTLTLSAISIMLSARFAYNSAIHPRLFKGNKYAWLSAAITAVLQVCITYIPGLNNIVFQMGPMTGKQWGITFLFVFVTFFAMEGEKGLMRFLKSRKFDTDDENEPYVHQNPVSNEVTEPFVSTASQRSAVMRETLLRK